MKAKDCTIPKQTSTLSMLMNSKPKPSEGTKPFVSFTQKLYEMVSDPQVEAICWNATGDGFIVLDTRHLCEDTFPHYFKHNSWPSFTRQLNMYGFQRAGGQDHSSMEFKHPQFLRGHPQHLRYIQRRVVSVSFPKEQQLNSLESHAQELKALNDQLQNEALERASLLRHQEQTISHVANILAKCLSNSTQPQPELANALHCLHTSLDRSRAPMPSPPIEQSYQTSPHHLPSIRHYIPPSTDGRIILPPLHISSPES